MHRGLLRVASSAAAARRFLSSSSAAPDEPPSALYSFLNPTLFSLKRKPNPSPQTPPTTPPPRPPSSTSPDAFAALESDLHVALASGDTDAAWRSFRSLASRSRFPSPDLSAALISHLSSLRDLHNLKRAFASAVLLLERSPRSLPFPTLASLFAALDAADTPAPAFALVRAMLKHRVFSPFAVWGGALVHLSKRNGGFDAFLRVFQENCRVGIEEGVRSMVPELGDFNAVLDGCCRELGSVADANRIIETMTNVGVQPDTESFGAMAYLFAWKGLEDRIRELDGLMSGLDIQDRGVIHRNLIGGYVKSGNFRLVSSAVLRALHEGREKDGENWRGFEGETHMEVVKCFLENGEIKDLAGLIIESQELESNPPLMAVECSLGYGIIGACVGLGWLDKAHSLLDEMTVRGAYVGLGVYASILKAYCKEGRTAEAAQLVTQIGAAGLQLDAGSYDALIDASMSAQDFHSAFSLFRGMREARLQDLKSSYLTIMTGLMENQRPELMAGFLDSVVGDPRVEITTHDWNSIIHSFCKTGRLEDARRTYRRMIFLQFEPNEQTYLSLINGNVSAEKYFGVLMLWTDAKKKMATKLDNALVDAFLYAFVKGGFFDAAMEVVEKAHEMKIFIDKWRYKQAFMETHKKLKVAKMRRRDSRKKESLVAFKNWAGLNT